MKTEFYKMEYEAWDEGTDDLSLELEAAYLRLCHQMYRRRGPIPAQAKSLARLWRVHTNKASALLKQLMDAGKVSLTPEGNLTNTRVERELNARGVTSTLKAEAGRKGGIHSGQVRSNSLENHDLPEADASSIEKQDEAIRVEESRVEERRKEKKIRPPLPRRTRTRDSGKSSPNEQAETQRSRQPKSSHLRSRATRAQAESATAPSIQR